MLLNRQTAERRKGVEKRKILYPHLEPSSLLPFNFPPLRQWSENCVVDTQGHDFSTNPSKWLNTFTRGATQWGTLSSSFVSCTEINQEWPFFFFFGGGENCFNQSLHLLWFYSSFTGTFRRFVIRIGNKFISSFPLLLVWLLKLLHHRPAPSVFPIIIIPHFNKQLHFAAFPGHHQLAQRAQC